jgi:putative membrane protein
MPELNWLLGALPNFARYVVTGFALVLLFVWIYALITPWREFALIRAGNTAAAIALVGAMLGFCLPLANTIAHAASLLDLLLWAGVALGVQVLVHLGLRLFLPYLREAIEADRTAAGITAGGFALSFGLVNAACLTT